MESEKPRGIAILTARTVAADTFILTRSLSGTFSAGSVPIRAPLTVDEDDDSCSGTDEHNSSISDASSYSRGLDSGTDFESVSGEADDETELEDVNIKVNRILGEELGRETGGGSEFSGESVIHRPFAVAGDIDEDTSLNYSSFEEESENSDEVESVSEVDRVSMKAKVVIPRVIMSLDDDEFDELLGSDDEEDALLCVLKAPGDKETDDKGFQYGVVDEPECSDSFIGEFVSTEEDVARLNYSKKLDNDEQSLRVPPGGCNNVMVENEGNFVEESMGLGQSFKQLIRERVGQRTIIKEDDGGSIHEFDTLTKQGDSAVELGEMGMTEKLEYLSSVTCELVSTEEDMVQEKCSDDLSVSLETNPDVFLGNCKEFLLKSEGNVADMDRGLDETFSQLVKQVVGQGSISKESYKRIDDSSSCKADELMIPVEGCIGLGSKESGDEDAGNLIDEAKKCGENHCDAGIELEKPEYEDNPEMGMNSVSFQMTENLNSVTTRNLEVVVGVDVLVSGCGCSDQKAGQESENEENQESKDFDRKLTLPDEVMSPGLSTSFEIADEIVETREQISQLINKQVSFQSDSEPDHSSLGTEETSLLSVKDVERTTPENSSVISYDVMEKETQVAQLIHNHSCMEVDEYEGTCHRMEKRSESTFHNYSEELSSGRNVQLISEKVKERVEKTQLLKEKLQRIIRTGFHDETSTVTEVVPKLSLAGGEHKTPLGLDYVSGERKVMLHGQDGPEDLNLSINVLVIGKTGVGKSATINSIFGETKAPVGAFGVTTKSANHIVGNVGGILVRILDTPGLMSSATAERFNQEVFMSIKKNMRMFPVDVILYIDRLDEPPDIHLLRIITTSLGSSVWRKMIVVLTHAASNVSDSSSYEDFIAQRSSIMHQSIRQIVPELSCVDQSKMPRIVLAENKMSSFCGNKTSESTFPNWRLNLLILCCSVKIRLKAGVLEKTGFSGSQLRSFTLFCSLWNMFLLGSNSRNHSHSHNGLEEKKRYLLDSYPEILWNEQSQECLEQETLLVENQGPQDEGLEERTVLRRVKTRRGRLGFQATKRFGIYLDTSGFSIGSGGCRKHEEEKGRILVRMSVLDLVPILMSVFTSVYGRKDT